MKIKAGLRLWQAGGISEGNDLRLLASELINTCEIKSYKNKNI